MKKTALLFFIIIFPFHISAEKQTVYWLKGDFPPFCISEGPHKENGSLDSLIDIYIKNLPDFDHKFISCSTARAVELLKSGKNVCHPGFHMTEERKKYAYFSVPSSIVSSCVIASADLKIREVLKSSSTIEFTASKKHRGGLIAGRSYGPVFDSIIENNRNNFYFVQGNASLKNILVMIKAGRIDYTFGYPCEIEFFKNQDKKFENIITVFPEETENMSWIKGYASAPRTKWGKFFIEKLNKVIETEKYKEEYIEAQIRWLPEEMKNDAVRAFNQKILSHK